MIDYLPFILSLAIGLLLGNILLRQTRQVDFFLLFFLAVGLGLGFSSLITFFSFFICNGFNRVVIFSAHLVLLLLLAIITVFDQKNLKSFIGCFKALRAWDAFYFILFLLYAGIIFVLACEHPFGEWDAWALWNMKTKFLMLSGSSWKDAFGQLHWHTQPDYPLLLPLVNAWGLVMAKKDFFLVALLTGVIFTVSCAGLFFAALRRYIDEKIALAAAGLFALLPFYAFMGTSQYADIVFAYYLLACVFCFLAVVRENDAGFAILLGIFLGLLSFTKNEGVAILFLVTLLSVGFLWRKNFKMIAFIAGGLAISLPVVIVFKNFLAPINRDILFEGGIKASKFFNYEGCYMIASFFFQTLSKADWNYVWPVMALGVGLGWSKRKNPEVTALGLFFIFYALILIFIYLTTINFDLNWRLSRTLPRILFYLLPSLVFFVFYAACQENHQDTKNSKH